MKQSKSAPDPEDRRRVRYHLHLRPDDNGTLLVTAPALPEVTTFGEDVESARRHALDAVIEALAARMNGGRDVPVDKQAANAASTTAVELVGPMAAQVEDYRARRSGAT